MSARTKGPRIVALLNQKGGVGKTTTTVNLGAGLAAAGLRTLLVDMDPQSNLSLHFGVEADDGRPTTSSLFADPPAKAADCVVKGRDNLSFIPADTELALVEGELAGRDGVQGVLRDALATLADRFPLSLFRYLAGTHTALGAQLRTDAATLTSAGASPAPDRMALGRALLHDIGVDVSSLANPVEAARVVQAEKAHEDKYKHIAEKQEQLAAQLLASDAAVLPPSST
jgi:hypothetical protein